MQTLDSKQIEQVSGGIWLNLAGGVAGAYGGFYGAIIGNSGATGVDILKGVLGGAAVGVLSPVNGFKQLIVAVGGGVVAGAVASAVDDVEFMYEAA